MGALVALEAEAVDELRLAIYQPNEQAEEGQIDEDHGVLAPKAGEEQIGVEAEGHDADVELRAAVVGAFQLGDLVAAADVADGEVGQSAQEAEQREGEGEGGGDQGLDEAGQLDVDAEVDERDDEQEA